MTFNSAFRAVMNERTIKDLTLKMEMLNKIPQEKIVRLFLDMCDTGLRLYIESEKKKYPNKTSSQIMREYYLNESKFRG